MIITLRDLQRFTSKLVRLEGKLVGIRLYGANNRKIMPGIIYFSEMSPEAVQWVQEKHQVDLSAHILHPQEASLYEF